MRILLYILSTLTVAAVIHAAGLTQHQLSTLAESMLVRVKMVDNLQQNGQNHTIRIYLRNNGTEPIPSSGWKLYFHSMLLLYPDIFPKNMSVFLDVEKVRIGMVQGDLYYLEPSTGFVEIKTGEERDYDIITALWSVSRTDFMPNWYLASEDPNVNPVVLKSTSSHDLKFVESFNDVRQWKRYSADRYNPYTPQERMRREAVRDMGKIGKLVVPTPSKFVVMESETTNIDNSWKIFSLEEKFNQSALYLKDLCNLELTSQIEPKTIVLAQVANLSVESYILKVEPSQNHIFLWSNDTDGMFYAVQSLRSILDGYKRINVPKIIMEDAPRYHYRGMHIDVARNFHSVDDIKRLIEVMAMYKLNRLHLHLSDDEGWRLEIPEIPELTQVGGQRCHEMNERKCIIPQFGSGPNNLTSGSGYFSTKDYLELLKFASHHHIKVLPEFDMPGHAHAAIVSMEERYRKYHEEGNDAEASRFRLKDPDDTSVYISVQQWMDNAVNPCINSTYAFIEKVIDTLIDLHKDIQPLENYIFGGDEMADGAWENSTACQAFMLANPKYTNTKGLKMYFTERVAAMVGEKNLSLGGWEDGFADPDHNPIDRSKLAVQGLYAIPWNNIWEWGSGSQAYKLANAGYKVILAQATNLYFDHPQEPDPEERGLYWATRSTDTLKVLKFMPDSLYNNIVEELSGKPITKHDICSDDISKCTALEKPENIIGMQGQLWSETVRSSENMDYMIFPRLIALAERAWHKADFETAPDKDRDVSFQKEWETFANTLGYKELQRLDATGIRYRVPPPGARVNADGKVEVSPTYPGLVTQISYDEGHSWINTSTQTSWRDGTKHVLLRTLSADQKRFSRSVVLYKEEPLPWVDQHMIDYIAENLRVQIDVIDNFEKDVKYAINFVRVKLQLHNTGTKDIPAGSWRIYFYSLYGSRPENLDCGLQVGHANGGLYYFTPASTNFEGIAHGESITCTYYNKNWMVTRTDNMPNWYVTSLGMKPKAIQSTVGESLDYVGQFDSPQKWKRQRNDKYDPFTPAVRYDLYSTNLSPIRKPYKIIPTPYSVSMDEAFSLKYTNEEWVVVNSTDFSFEAKYLAEKLDSPLHQDKPDKYFIHFKKNVLSENNSDAYEMSIDSDHITITAESSSGAFYGSQSLISLIEGNDGNLVKMTIKDKPRYAYRGVMPDTARNFKPKQWVFQFLDMMAMYKLNKLHFHLTDDEAWRFEVPAIPDLHQMASKRCHSDYSGVCVLPQLGSGPDNDTSGSGFYTVQDYRDILKYANERHIQVIPEIDMPGHSAAAIVAMDFRESQILKMKRHGEPTLPESYLLRSQPVENIFSILKWSRNAIDPCLNTTYKFVEAVIDALIELHRPVQPLKVFHLGGDEVASGAWNDSSACISMFGPGKQTETQKLQLYFVKRVADIVASKGLDVAAWDDGVYADERPYPLSDYKSRQVYVYPWDNRGVNIKRPSEFANAGYKVVLPLATHLYFDQSQGPDPEERGLYWGARYTDTEKTFGLMPDDLYANVNVDPMGYPINLTELCGNKACPKVNKTENVIGIEACLWAETMRTRDQFHYMAFPRLLALAERAWYKALWEDIQNIDQRNSQRTKAWKEFSDTLGFKELKRLDKHNVSYRIPPPGAREIDGVLKANTKYANLEIQWKKDGDQRWETFVETKLPHGSQTYLLRAKSKTSDVSSRAIAYSTHKTSASARCSCSLYLVVLYLLISIILLNVH